MFFKLSILAALVAPFASALSVNAPSEAVFNGGSMTFTWTVSSGDPDTFSVYLTNPSFHSIFGVANNVQATKGTLTIQIPAVPPNQQYTIILVPINNATDVLAQSPSFNIGPIQSTSTPDTAASTPAATGGTTIANTPATTPLLPSVTSSGFGVTVSNTAPASTSGTGSSGASAASSTPSSAALPVRISTNTGVIASVILSVFAGAAAIAL